MLETSTPVKKVWDMVIKINIRQVLIKENRETHRKSNIKILSITFENNLSPENYAPEPNEVKYQF